MDVEKLVDEKGELKPSCLFCSKPLPYGQKTRENNYTHKWKREGEKLYLIEEFVITLKTEYPFYCETCNPFASVEILDEVLVEIQ